MNKSRFLFFVPLFFLFAALTVAGCGDEGTDAQMSNSPPSSARTAAGRQAGGPPGPSGLRARRNATVQPAALRRAAATSQLGRDLARAGLAKWTVMFFFDCDNDLEAPSMDLIEALAKVGSTRDVQIVALADRCKRARPADEYTNRRVLNLPNWTTGKLLHIEKGRLGEIGDYGETNMGDADTLARFALDMAHRYPAQHYALIFGDHGSDWAGFNGDEASDDDSLTLAEMENGLRQITAKLGRLDLVHFDNCLMANVEVATSVAPYARYMTASEELMPGAGCDYESISARLTASPDMDAVALGHTFCETYRRFYINSDDADTRDEGRGVTLSLLDLDAFSDLAQATNQFGAACASALRTGGRASWKKMAYVRSRAEEYGRDADAKEGEAVFDLAHVADLASRKFGVGPVADAADTVTRAVERTVLMEVHGRGRSHAHGVSIYLPKDAEYLSGTVDDNPYNRTTWAQGPGANWLSFVRAYTGAKGGAAPDPNAPIPDLLADVRVSRATLSENQTATVSATFTGAAEDVQSVAFTLAEIEGGDTVIIGQRPAVPDKRGRLSEEWDGSWFFFGDGKNELSCPLMNWQTVKGENEAYLATAPAQIKLRDDTRWRDVTLHLYVNLGGKEVTGKLVYAYVEGRSGPRQIKLTQGTKIRPTWLARNKNGEESYYHADSRADILTIRRDASDITVSEGLLENGNYRIGFTVTDLSGTARDALTPIRVK